MTDGSSGALSSGASEKTECKEHSLKGTVQSKRFFIYFFLKMLSQLFLFSSNGVFFFSDRLLGLLC